MEKSTGFLNRAWTDLTSDEGWWQPVTILALVSLIPIVGSFFVTGYLLDWGREGAWGMTRSLPHKVGDAGKRFKWGFFAVVIALVWILPFAIVLSILSIIPLIGVLILAFGCIAMLGISAIAVVGCVNMTIYDNIKAGLQFKRLVEMAKMDVNGLGRCLLITLLTGVPACVYSILCGSSLIPFMSQLAQSGVIDGNAITLSTGLLGTGAFATTAGSVLYLVMVFANTLLMALEYRAYGYWVGQFQPAKWGGLEQPMPFEPGYTERRAAAPTANDAQSTSYDDVKEQVAGAAASAGAFVKETAEKAADVVSDAAAGFKTENVEAADEPQVIEAEVVSVDDVEPEEKATEEEQPTSTVAFCPNCGAHVEGHHNYCVNCGGKL